MTRADAAGGDVADEPGDAGSERVDRAIPYVETHHHVWELDRFPYPWLRGPGHDPVMGDVRPLQEDWPPARVHADLASVGVAACVHVEADAGVADPVAETAWLESIAATTGRPDALVVFADLGAPDVGRELDRHLATSERVRGVRIREHPAEASAVFHAGLDALASRGLSYELSASPGRLAIAREDLARHPDLEVVLGHAGFPVARDPDHLARWRREIGALAELPRVVCKVSGFATIDHAWTVEPLRPLMLACIDAFGVDRIMFGTDWPVASLYGTYAEAVGAYRTILAEAGFTQAEQTRMLGGTARAVYRL